MLFQCVREEKKKGLRKFSAAIIFGFLNKIGGLIEFYKIILDSFQLKNTKNIAQI